MNQTVETLRMNYVRSQAEFANVIQELEAELKRMAENERIPQELVTKKDEQIETLIKFNNRIEDLFNTYKLLNLNLQIEMMATQTMLWDAIKSQKTAFEAVMHQLVKVPKENSNYKHQTHE